MELRTKFKIKIQNKELKIDSKNYDSLIELMDNYLMYDDLYVGKNENGEWVYARIYEDRVFVETYQSNGWVRQNTFWRDFTTEETFEGRYK